jgi:hypothetical protein
MCGTFRSNGCTASRACERITGNDGWLLERKKLDVVAGGERVRRELVVVHGGLRPLVGGAQMVTIGRRRRQQR